jgi:hypothetical protein
MNLKNILITLSCVAGVLFIITFYVVFYGSGGTYVISSSLGSGAGIFSTSTSTIASASGAASSTASSTLAEASSSASSTEGGPSTGTQTGAASISWTQGGNTLSIVGASLSGSQLTLDVQIAMGSTPGCVPLTMRLIADEQGNLSAPITPQFTFPDTGSCNGTSGETYSAQPVTFTLNSPVVFPVVFTTGGTANTIFEVDQNADNSLTVQLPPSAG